MPVCKCTMKFSSIYAIEPSSILTSIHCMDPSHTATFKAWHTRTGSHPQQHRPSADCGQPSVCSGSFPLNPAFGQTMGRLSGLVGFLWRAADWRVRCRYQLTLILTSRLPGPTQGMRLGNLRLVWAYRTQLLSFLRCEEFRN